MPQFSSNDCLSNGKVLLLATMFKEDSATQLTLRRLATNPTAPRPASNQAYVSGTGIAATFKPTTMSSRSAEQPRCSLLCGEIHRVTQSGA